MKDTRKILNESIFGRQSNQGDGRLTATDTIYDMAEMVKDFTDRPLKENAEPKFIKFYQDLTDSGLIKYMNESIRTKAEKLIELGYITPPRYAESQEFNRDLDLQAVQKGTADIPASSGDVTHVGKMEQGPDSTVADIPKPEGKSVPGKKGDKGKKGETTGIKAGNSLQQIKDKKSGDYTGSKVGSLHAESKKRK